MNISPVVITSRRAQEHLSNIKLQHADLLEAMQTQSQKVAQFNADKDVKQQEAMFRAKELQDKNEQVLKDNEVKRLEAENKRRELEIKAQALSL